ncbi:MAG: outer membrane protein assembly factor BamE [Pseudomonadota bacterium]|nr:outer membrane protein assembly factor BamE [Pseudomonadota bacterium]
MTSRLFCITLFFLTIAGCSPKVDNRGYVSEQSIKDQIVVGQTTKDQVKEKLGSPSAQSSFGDENWYYITGRKEAYAFFRPSVVEQQVVRIAFDPSGVVTGVDAFNKDDGKDFAIAKGATPTEGHTLGFFEQALGNIGRFNNPGNANNPTNPSVPGTGH